MKSYYKTMILYGIKKGYWTKENYPKENYPKQIKLNNMDGIEKKVESKIPNHSYKTYVYRNDRQE